MKKILLKILGAVLCVCMLGSMLVGCNETKWGGTQMIDWGNVNAQSLGGFVAETDNYVYYLNGMAVSTKDNTFGVPVKGALMAAKKSDLTDTEVVVPKLFAASDYSAGIYIYGDYVYYGSPSTDKTPDGTVANSEMMFMKSKLDGTGTKVLFSVGTLSTQYRIVGAGEDVYVIYYDTASASIISRNVNTGSAITVAKTDEKIDGYESLNKYMFMKNSVTGKAVVVYTTTVYQFPEYNADLAEAMGSRPAQKYNKLYAYVAGEAEGTCIYDGKDAKETYDLLLVDENYVYYSATDENANVDAYAVTILDFIANANAQTESSKVKGEIIDSTYAVSTNLIVSIDEVYTFDSEVGKLYKDTLRKYSKNKTCVAVSSTISSLITVKGDFVYYYNTNNQICKTYIGDGEAQYSFDGQTVNYNIEDAMEIRISDDTAVTTWYQPEFVNISGVEYLFYCDNSSAGMQYVKYVDLGAVAVGEDTDNNDEADKFYVEGGKMIGEILNADKADMYEYKVNNVSTKLDNGVLPLEKDDDGNYKLNSENKLYSTLIEELRSEYDALPSAVKNKVEKEVVEDLENYERAIEIANLMYTIKGSEKINQYEETSTEYLSIKNAYDAVKADLQKYYKNDDWSTIDALIENNIKAYYWTARNEFDPVKD